ncbi:MAG TPA: SRPBCC domain-containing protein [Acidimicrobiales bacterium]|jgi:uncharacterized protein YndB with AHSA1/START domain
MTDTAIATTVIEQTTHIAASPETVWKFWTDPQAMTEWMGTATDLDAQPGGPFRVEMDNGHTFSGRFTEVDAPRRLVFTFGWEGNEPGTPLAPESTTVEVELTADGDGTLLVLRHLDMPTTHEADHIKGWTFLVGERLVAAAAA